uniref:Pathogen-related protein n=1 Tax=Siraitia grosvenorii TaxID=190515 RepID=K7NBX2_SIRGR|nr:pathogen-related protein [Siraitia grosvenorii]
MKRESAHLPPIKLPISGHSEPQTTPVWLKESIKMSTEGGSRGTILPDKYRSSLHLEHPTVHWRHGKPPTYHSVNQLFEEGRTKEWAKGSLEETVQNAVKLWQMEFNNKARLQDFKTINHEKFKIHVNGREGLSGEETVKLGSFNALLKSSLPEEFQFFKAEKETFESSHADFGSCFPRGFPWEVIQVYSGPPLIIFKFRHWGFFEGPYKGHQPTGELIQFFGLVILKVDESLRVEEVEIYYDPAELFGKLLKGKKTDSESKTKTKDNEKDEAPSVGCPFTEHNK